MQPVDAPAPQAPAVPALGAVGAASTLAAWILDHARDDFMRGRPVPDAVAAHVRDLLQPAPLAASGNPDNQPETLEKPDGYFVAGEVSRVTGINPRTLRHLASKGLINGRKADASTRLYDLASVQEYLRRQ